jgi:hypothetical protein
LAEKADTLQAALSAPDSADESESEEIVESEEDN